MFNIENSSGNTWPEAVWHLLVGKAGRARAEADGVQSMRGQLEGQLSPSTAGLPLLYVGSSDLVTK